MIILKNVTMLNTFLGGMCNGSDGNDFVEEECTGDI